MKSKKSSTVYDKINKKSESDITKNISDSRNKRKSTLNSFLQKNSQILQTYTTFFKKPIYNFGDADTYFRQTLRNYDNCDLNNFKWEATKSIKSTKSLESIPTHKQKLTLPSNFGDGDAKQLNTFQKHFEKVDKYFKFEEAKLTTEESTFKAECATTEEEEELDLDIFYSPSSQLLEDLEDIKEVDESSTKSTKDLASSETADLPEVIVTGTSSTKSSSSSSSELAMAEEEEIPSADEVSPDEDAAPDDALKEVEDLVDQATTELDQVIEDNPELQKALEGDVDNLEAAIEGAEGPTPAQGDMGSKRGSTFKYDPNIDATVLRELEDAEQQAMATAKIIYELKERVAQLLSTPKMTEVQARELEEKNHQLREQMQLFEEKTKRIQFLIEQGNLFENLLMPKPALQGKHKEDMLPKVIICGTTESNMPKIIVCDDKKKKDGRKSSAALPPAGVMPQFAKRLSDSYNMQEKLANENADLEGKRYQLQEDLLNKDQTVESLQRKLGSLQTEMRLICKENCLLNQKLQNQDACPAPCGKGGSDIEEHEPYCKKSKKKMPCGKGKGPCPADVETRLQEYSETTQHLEKQLSDMEGEVRNMQNELVAVQKERQHLEHHRRMLCTPPPCPPPCSPCPPKPPCPGPCNPMRMGGSSDVQLRELREQYNRLQDDYKGKLTEVAGLRADNEKSKQIAKDSEEFKKIAEDKLKECERELKVFRSEKDKLQGSKEQLIEQEQQLNVAKQRFREAQDELEELRALIQDQQSQLDDYRNKYLQAQQQVEEQRRSIDMMEMENNRIGEQVNLEIQRVKNQFQEKLQELTPLPDILKATQIKLQEAQQMHLLAERNNEALVRELQAFRDKAAAMANQMEKVRSDQQLGADERATLQQRADEFERKCNELQEECDTLKTDLARMEEVAEQNEKRVQEKLHEIAQLMAQLETVREESARQVARTKDRCETVRRSMQNQIADLERQLAQSRAQARQAQKDRDEIRQKMQSQINNLNENFEDAQMRIRNLQGHVNFLKNSYTNVFPPNDPNVAMISDGMDPCNCGNEY